MATPDPIIPKLLSMKQRDQERRLNELQGDMRAIRQKLSELDREYLSLDDRTDGLERMSVENGYLSFLEHRQGLLRERLAGLQAQADAVQAALRKSVYSQSMLRDS